jgi:Lrp/AsnC family transcriptional regulator
MGYIRYNNLHMIDNTEFDTIDTKLLIALQEDSSLSMQALGERVGLSANPVWRRIRRLEEIGVITGRTVRVNPSMLGLKLTAFVSVRTGQHESAWLEKFAHAVSAISEIIECHRMSGDIDYLLKILVSDMAHYDRVYKSLIKKVPGLIDVSSAFSMEVMKNNQLIDPATSVRNHP